MNVDKAIGGSIDNAQANFDHNLGGASIVKSYPANSWGGGVRYAR